MTHSDGSTRSTLVAAVTCRSQVSPPSAQQADRSPPGAPRWSWAPGSIPPQRAEGVREVAPFSTICHYLKWHVIVLSSQIHYASTESRKLNCGGRGTVLGWAWQWKRGRGSTLIHLQAAVLWGPGGARRAKCLFFQPVSTLVLHCGRSRCVPPVPPEEADSRGQRLRCLSQHCHTLTLS